MAQSRMAGVAMGLGPDDLADVGEAATMATNKMGMEQGQQASMIHDLQKRKVALVNDGRPLMIFTDGKTTSWQESNDPFVANPVPSNKGVAGRNGRKAIMPIQDQRDIEPLYQVHENNIRQKRFMDGHTGAQYIYDNF